MKKIKIIIFVFCLLKIINCNSQKISLEYQNDNLINEIGIGLVQQINVEKKIILYDDISCQKIKNKNAKIGKDIIPLLNKIDYGILYFICVEKNNKYYKIALKNNKYAYLKPSKTFMFYNWNDFFKNQVISVESKNNKTNPLLDKISGKPLFYENLKSDDEVEIIQIKDDWLNIKNTTINEKYWIKWKEKKELLIYLNLLM